MRYFIYGYYGYGNFGDDLLLHALVRGIRSRDTRATFVIHNLNPVEGLEREPYVRFTNVARKLMGLRRHSWRIVSYLRQVAAGLALSDVMVIGGGTLFLDKGRLNPSLCFLYLMVLYARWHHLPVIITGVGIDDLRHPISRWVTRGILKRAHYVAVRDEFSFSYARRIRSNGVFRSADLAFALNNQEQNSNASRVRPNVGLCFIDYFRTMEPSATRHTAYIGAIKRLVERNREQCDFSIVILQEGIGQRDDWLLEIFDKQKFQVMHVTSMEEATMLAASVDALVVTRYHLAILGARWRKPVVVIDHERKMGELADELALPSVTLERFLTEDIDLEWFTRPFDPSNTLRRCEKQEHLVDINFAWLDEIALPPTNSTEPVAGPR